MLYSLYLLRYNNYYNRVVKKEATILDYNGSYLVKYNGNTNDENGNSSVIHNVNFNPNDGVNTMQVVNWGGEVPDYVVVFKDLFSPIESRWFVINWVRTREGQLQLFLRRDVLVDYETAIVNQPCFIERGIPKSTTDPAIYKKGENTYNQIKRSETLLKDETGCPWVVGFVPRNYRFDNKITASMPVAGAYDISVTNLSDYTYYNYTQEGTAEFRANPFDKQYVIQNIGEKIRSNASYADYYIRTHIINQSLQTVSSSNSKITNTQFDGLTLKTSQINVEDQPSWDQLNSGYTSYIAEMNQVFNNALTTPPQSASSTQAFLAQNNKVIYASATNSYYRINIEEVRTETYNNEVTQGSRLYNDLAAGLKRTLTTPNGSTISIEGYPTASNFRITATGKVYRIVLGQFQLGLSVNLSGDRYHLPEQAFDMFCMPYSDTLTIYKDGEVYLQNTSAEAALNMAMQIVTSTGEGTIYDIQILPYCPVRYCIKDDGTFDIGGAYVADITSDAAGDPKVSVLLWANTSKFSVPNIPLQISGGTTVKEKKVISETKIYRLCSPNYSGVFEFNPAINDGVDFIKVDCTYQPFSPYIRATINFKGLYGDEFGDSRGLICGGDFSLPQITDAWANYQLQNKNYNVIFDRQIQNMEVSNNVAREQEKWSTTAGALSSVVTGAAAGAMVAGPWGALAGLGTGALSAAGGVRDIQLNEKLRQEGIDFATDMFRMNNENIQALPQGLSKTNPFTINNKLFPFIEEYDCTLDEKNALELQLEYRGMEIGRIDYIATFLENNKKNYIKAKLIRVDNLAQDYHVATAIAEELYKGVFM